MIQSEEHTHYPENVIIWEGIIGNHIVGPFFIHGNLKGEKYLELIQNTVILMNLYPDPEIHEFLTI